METLGLTRSRFLFFLALTAGIHLASYTDFGYALSLGFFFVGLLLLAQNPSGGISFFFISVVLFDDINKYDIDLPPLHSIFTIDFYGQSTTMIWSIIVFVVVLINFLIDRKNLKVTFPIFVLVIFFVVGLTRIYQFRNARFISDVAFVINILLGYGVGLILLKTSDSIRYYFGLIITIFLSKYIVITVHAVFLSLTGILYTLKGESTANYLIVPLILMLIIIFNKRVRFSGVEKLMAFIYLAFIGSYLLITISRERILFVAFALIAYLLVYKKVQLVFYLAIGSILAIVVLANYNPYMYDFITWKLTSLLPTSGGNINASSSTRLLEFNNIWQEQFQSFYKPFIGTGWGGYFTDRYHPFPPEILDPTSYPKEWIDNRTFFVPHGTYLYVLLKYGLLGAILFYGSFIYHACHNLFDKKIYKLPLTDRDSWGLRYIQIALCISVPIVALVIFTSKLQIMTGFFLAIIFKIRQIIELRSEGVDKRNLLTETV